MKKLNRLIELLEEKNSDPRVAKIAKLKASLAEDFKEIAQIEKELLAMAKAQNNQLTHRGKPVAEAVQNPDNFRVTNFLKALPEALLSALGKVNGQTALATFTDTKKKFVSPSKTWKLRIL